MMKVRLIAAAAGALAAAAVAQAPAPLGSLSGVVLDAVTQKPLAEAQVTAHGAGLIGEQSAITNEAGFFELTMLPQGTYGLTVTRDGYGTFSPEGLDLKTRRTRIKLQLAPAEAPPPPPPPVPLAPDFDAASMTAPAMVSGPAPEYTPEAIEHNVEGLMVVRCVVTAEGMVRSCKVQKGLPFMDRACVDALQARKYKPATQQGKPLDVLYTFNIRLKLPQQ